MEETQVETTEEVKKELDPEKQMLEMRALAQMKHKTFSQLLALHIDSFSATMVSNNKTSYNDKIQAANGLKEAILFALDFGLSVSRAKIRQGGKLSKEVNGLAGIMVQALDNRMLLMADRMNEQEKNEELNKSVETTEGETNDLEK